MRERYIREVERALALPRGKRREVLTDLSEIFDSAREHGETEAAVLERLGPPQVYAAGVEEQLGMDRGLLRRRRLTWAAAAAILAAAAWGLLAFLFSKQMPDGVIGQADAMTAIQVQGMVNPAWLLAGLGLAATLAAVWLVLRAVGRR